MSALDCYYITHILIFLIIIFFTRYDENTLSMDTGFPKEIAHGFPGIGKQVDAVFQEGGKAHPVSSFFCRRNNTWAVP